MKSCICTEPLQLTLHGTWRCMLLRNGQPPHQASTKEWARLPYFRTLEQKALLEIMTNIRPGTQRVGKSPINVASAAEAEDINDAYVDDEGMGAEEIGKLFTYRSTLTASETAALELQKRDKYDDDEEQFPLSVKQRNVTYADIHRPVASCQLGPDAEALCMAASHSGKMLAVGGRHGSVQLINPRTMQVVDTIHMAELAPDTGPSGGGGGANGGRGGGPGDSGVVTAVSFRPDLPGSKMQNLLLAAMGDAVVHLHTGTRRVVHVNREPGNRINAASMREDGQLFATAGSDFVVRVYDEATCSVCRTLDHGDGVTTTGHTNHVFSLAWHPDDTQILLSGGWDNHVLVWDLRVHRSVRSIPGPHLCGEALDVQPGTMQVLTGSWRHQNPLQLWDLRTCRLLTNLPWWQPEQDACLLYAARFGRGAAAGTVVAGGSGSKPMVRVYQLNVPGNVELQFTVQLDRAVHALTLLPTAPPTSNAGVGEGAAGDSARGLLAVCCDREVHSVAV